ncbi:hypothetical protein V8F20_006651 [Naviculisporaceae sp. PSN 640]
MSVNPNSVANQGEFHDSVPGTSRKPHGEPLRRFLNREIGTDEHPIYHAQTFPKGTAPKEHSFSPNPINEIPGQALNPDMPPSLRTDPSSMPGSTSKTVYNKEDTTTGGRPIEGLPKRVTSPAQTPQKKSSTLHESPESEEEIHGTKYRPPYVEEFIEESIKFKFKSW